MRSSEELHRAIAIVGSSFALDSELRRFIWEGYPYEFERAKGMFLALCWMVGTDQSGVEKTLEYVQLKLAQYTEQEKEKTHAE